MSATELYGMLMAWGGIETRVRILDETPQRYRVEAIQPTPLPGRARWLARNANALVPKRAIRILEGDG